MPETSPVSAVDLAAVPPPRTALPPRLRPVYPALLGALIRARLTEARLRLRNAIYASRLYRFSLIGPLPDRPNVLPEALAPASLEGAQEIMRGRFLLPSGTLKVRDQSPFDAALAEPELRADLHRFRWLADLERAGGQTAHFLARALLEDWLDRFQQFHAFVWRPDILGPRLVAWAAHLRFLQPENDLIFRSRLMRAFAEQKRHLTRTLGNVPSGLPALEASAALVTMDAVLSTGQRHHARNIEALRQAVAHAVLPDGGFVTRSPRDLAMAVAALGRAALALDEAGMARPPFLLPMLDRMRLVLGMMRHADGRLACFNGSNEGMEPWLEDLLAGTEPPDEPLFAPQSRYVRLGGEESRVLFDCGGPAPGHNAVGSHAGPLAFEFSRGEQRLVVNGGVAWRRGGEWIDAARRTAAHATIELNGNDAGAILEGSQGVRLGPQLYGGRGDGTMQAADGGCWAEGWHDLYAAGYGITHRRRLFLDRTGQDFRGEDRLERASIGASTGDRVAIALRFPLHPDCRATLAQGGDSVLIAPPTAEAWRFRTTLTAPDQKLSLEPALYMGGETVRRTNAIVLRATLLGREWTAHWAFKLENPGRRSRRVVVV